MNFSYKLAINDRIERLYGMSTSETIKKLRRKLLLTQQEFAHLVGVGVSTISQYEQGIRTPRMSSIKKIKKVAEKHNIKIDIEDFFD